MLNHHTISRPLPLNKIYSLLGASDQSSSIVTPREMDFFMTFYLDEIRNTGKNHLLTSCIEEAPIFLEQLDCIIKTLPVDENGRLRLDALEEALKPKVSLLTLSWANGLTGVIQPIQQIVELCHAKGVKVHVVGKMDVAFDDTAIDFLSFDVEGVRGFLQRKKKAENGPAFDSLPAIEMARLRDAFEAELKHAIPDCAILFQNVERLASISVVAFPGVMSESLLYALHRRGVFASTKNLSSQLKHCGIADELCHSAVSFALSDKTTEDDLADALDIIVTSVRKLKTLSMAL